MLKKVLPYILLLLFSLFFPFRVFAAEKQFDISVDSQYEVKADGITDISQTISITNKTEYYYTPSYTVSVGFSDISNIQAYNSDGSIPTTLTEKGEKDKSIKLSFPKRYAGLNDKNVFTLKFSTKDIAKKQGSVWEVTIPGIEKPEDFGTYTTTISVPDDFGKASIIKPAKQAKEGESIKLSKDDVGQSGVYILYGDRQYYSFNLNYNISNPNLFPVRTEIALPPQTNYQNVLISAFSEEPVNVDRDGDGNWIAEYRLLPQQKKSVVVKGIIEILSQPREESLTNKQLKEYTTSKKYWDLGNQRTRVDIKELKSAEDIYNYVQKTLTYNYKKIATDNLRLGGQGALTDLKNSVCLEFTDLFISIARAKGIPARSVEGFAFTQNAKLRPLSLVNDILHAWPEYYDLKSKRWIMVDPTWGNTTKGMDYFTSLDFSHVAFAVKGIDSEYPIPAGGYKFNKESKDVEVSFAKSSEFDEKKNIQITDNLPNFSFPKIDIQGTVKIKNSGNVAYSNVTVDVRSSRGTKRQFIVDYLPPRGRREITTTFSDIPFLTNEKYIITIQVGKSIHTKEIKISFIPDYKILILIGGIIGVSAIISAITFHTGGIYIQRRRRKNSLRR
jgi:hypothetical protein